MNVYSLSHQVQRIGQPVRRTKVQGRPACVDSPWIEWKISVTLSIFQILDFRFVIVDFVAANRSRLASSNLRANESAGRV